MKVLMCEKCKYFKKDGSMYLCVVDGETNMRAFGMDKEAFEASWIPERCPITMELGSKIIDFIVREKLLTILTENVVVWDSHAPREIGEFVAKELQ